MLLWADATVLSVCRTSVQTHLLSFPIVSRPDRRIDSGYPHQKVNWTGDAKVESNRNCDLSNLSCWEKYEQRLSVSIARLRLSEKIYLMNKRLTSWVYNESDRSSRKGDNILLDLNEKLKLLLVNIPPPRNSQLLPQCKCSTSQSN
jgi:hypothetical protein